MTASEMLSRPDDEQDGSLVVGMIWVLAANLVLLPALLKLRAVTRRA